MPSYGLNDLEYLARGGNVVVVVVVVVVGSYPAVFKYGP